MNDNAIQEFVEAIKETPQNTNNTYSAVVSRVDDEGVIWVNLAGSNKETPTASTSAEVESGDIVDVEWRNNKLYIAGNSTNPSAGIKVVQVVQQVAEEASEKSDIAYANSEEAKGYAGSAYKIAADTNQYFWFVEEGTDTGAHITEIPKDDFLEDPENGGGNLLARSNGIAVRDGLSELATFSSEQIRLGGTTTYNALLEGRLLKFVEGDTTYASIGLLDGTRREWGVLVNDHDEVHNESILSNYGLQIINNRNEGWVSLGHDEILFYDMSNDESLSINAYFTATDKLLDINGFEVHRSLVNNENYVGNDKVWLGTGSGGVNHGVYSLENQRWIVHADDNDNVFIGGINTSNIMQNAQEPDLITPTITASVGAVNDATIVKYGRVVTFIGTFRKTSATAAGSNLFEGTMPAAYRPQSRVTGVGYNGSAAAVLQMTTGGAMVVRVTGAQIAANANVYISATYII